MYRIISYYYGLPTASVWARVGLLRTLLVLGSGLGQDVRLQNDVRDGDFWGADVRGEAGVWVGVNFPSLALQLLRLRK